MPLAYLGQRIIGSISERSSAGCFPAPWGRHSRAHSAQGIKSNIIDPCGEYSRLHGYRLCRAVCFWPQPFGGNLRAATIKLLLPVIALAGLSCTSRFNPLWPQGVEQLTRQENDMRQALPIGIGVEPARAVLRSKGVDFSDKIETTQGIVFDDGKGHRIIAAPGNRVLAARKQTEAWAFPCGYDIRIVLLFGQDEVLSQEYIDRFRICP